MTGYFQAFELDELEKKHAAAGSPYSEFLRRRGVSMGMYTLPAGTADHQHPHSADEVYIVLRGRGTLRVVDTDHEVKAGSIVSVDHGRGSPLHRRCRGPADPRRLRAAGHPRRLTARPECGPQRPRCPRLQPPTPARRLCGPRCRRGVGPCREDLRNSKRVPGKSPAARSTETVAVLDVGFVGREAGWRRWFAPHDVGVAAVG